MSTPHLAVAPLLVALATAVLTLLTRPSVRLQRATSVAGSVGYLVVVAALAQRVLSSGALVYQVSDWRPPFGIVVVADPLSVFMLSLAAVVSLPAVVYAVSYVDEFGQRLSYHPLYHFMLVGVSGAFLTGDVFNLFVWFEVMLMSSYVLVLFYSQATHTRAALSYVVLNLVGSAVMLLAIGGLYATTGTLNMADMARRLANPAAFDVAVLPTLGLGALLFAVFALKAGLVPFHFWVPAAYRAAPSPVTAVLAGVVKKVGVYAIVRLYFTVFAAAEAGAGSFALPWFRPAAAGAFLGYFGPVLFLMGGASILLGGFAAVGRDDLDDLLAFSSIGQVGFIVLPLAVAATAPQLRVLGVTAALLYAFNHGLAKSLLFLVAGTVGDAAGTDRLDDLGGVAGRAPLVSGAFFVGMLALIGVPPLPGFFGKFFVFRVGAQGWGLGVPAATWVLGLALVGAVLTIAYFTRAWNAVFWGRPTEHVDVGFAGRVRADGGSAGDDGDGDESHGDDGGTTADAPDTGATTETTAGSEAPLAPSPAVPRLQLVALAGLALLVVAAGVGFEVVLSAARAAAEAAVDTGAYVEAVDPATAGEGGGSHSLLALLAGTGAVRRRPHGDDAAGGDTGWPGGDAE